jgi:RES domain-containing protein
MAVLTGRRVFRVCRARYARLDGTGARLVGGRWNSSGRAVVYMAESIALAVLENLVHMTRQDFPRGYVCVAAVLPDGISILSEKDLREQPALADQSAEQLGDWWLDSRTSAVLQVPSFVIYKAFARSDPSRYQPDALRVKHLLDELSTLRVK